MRVFFLSLSLAMSMACDQLNRQAETVNPTYFDLEAFCNIQIELLEKRGPNILKTASFEQDSTTREIDGGDVKWEKELEILGGLDLNKPRFVGAFDVIEMGDSTSYQLKKGEKASVKSLTLHRDQNGEIVRIFGDFQEQKEIYETKRTIDFRFESGIFSSYSVEGYQKMLTGDSTSFSVQVKVP
ncbi:MAG: hypothetical protein KI790_02810 [Cyclobacteriaceae bacterium]|nr:hypothetical protein [Cyclobacteriaceae bacterium HetDA_MAG_MS6]